MELNEASLLEDSANPLDVVEAILSEQDWVYERPAGDELSVVVQGHWCTYHLSFSWHEALEALHLACTFDVKVPREKRNEIANLLVMINEQLWAGHFDMWSEDGMLIFRYGLLLQGNAEFTLEQANALLQLGVDNCERYFPAFQFVLWGGKTAAESMEASMFETAGQA